MHILGALETYWKGTDVDGTVGGDDGDGVARGTRAILGQVRLKISAVEVLADESHSVVRGTVQRHILIQMILQSLTCRDGGYQ